MVEESKVTPVALTQAQIEELPTSAVLLDAEGDLWQRRFGRWCAYACDPVDSQELAAFGPFTVYVRSPQPAPPLDEASIRADERERIAKHLESARIATWNARTRAVSNWGRAAAEVRSLGEA